MNNINQNDIDFILTKMVIPSYIRDKLSKSYEGLAAMTEDDFDMLSDLCGQHFQLFGIKKDNDEPNKYGLRLEDLLNKLNKI